MRHRIWDAMLDADVPLKRLNRFEDCGQHAWVIRNLEDPNRYKVAANTCHDRWCVPCQRDRSYVLARNVLALVDGKMARLITLTLKAEHTPLADRVARLQLCFANLRKTLLWKRKVLGGAAFLEIKWSAERQSWHAHLHLIVVGSYIPRTELSRLWYRVTGDSMVTDIRLARSPKMAATYVTKYVSKPFDAELTGHHERLTEAIHALAHVKMCITFGTFRGSLLTQTPNPDSWEYVGMLYDILNRAKAGDPDACEVTHALNTGSVLSAMEYATALAPRAPPAPPPVPDRQTLMFQDAYDPRF